jgi:hypothetical protein
LQDDLRYKDAVWISFCAPGERALKLLKPAQQSLAKHGFILPLAGSMFKRGHAGKNCSVIAVVKRHVANSMSAKSQPRTAGLILLFFCV